MSEAKRGNKQKKALRKYKPGEIGDTGAELYLFDHHYKDKCLKAHTCTSLVVEYLRSFKTEKERNAELDKLQNSVFVLNHFDQDGLIARWIIKHWKTLSDEQIDFLVTLVHFSDNFDMPERYKGGKRLRRLNMILFSLISSANNGEISFSMIFNSFAEIFQYVYEREHSKKDVLRKLKEIDSSGKMADVYSEHLKEVKKTKSLLGQWWKRGRIKEEGDVVYVTTEEELDNLALVMNVKQRMKKNGDNRPKVILNIKEVGGGYKARIRLANAEPEDDVDLYRIYDALNAAETGSSTWGGRWNAGACFNNGPSSLAPKQIIDIIHRAFTRPLTPTNLARLGRRQLPAEGRGKPEPSANTAIGTKGVYTREWHSRVNAKIKESIDYDKCTKVTIGEGDPNSEWLEEGLQSDIAVGASGKILQRLEEIKEIIGDTNSHYFEGTELYLINPLSRISPYFINCTYDQNGKINDYQLAHAGTYEKLEGNRARNVFMTHVAFLELPVELVAKIFLREAKLAHVRHKQYSEGHTVLYPNSYDDKAKNILREFYSVVRDRRKFSHNNSITMQEILGPGILPEEWPVPIEVFNREEKINADDYNRTIAMSEVINIAKKSQDIDLVREILTSTSLSGQISGEYWSFYRRLQRYDFIFSKDQLAFLGQGNREIAKNNFITLIARSYFGNGLPELLKAKITEKINDMTKGIPSPQLAVATPGMYTPWEHDSTNLWIGECSGRGNYIDLVYGDEEWIIEKGEDFNIDQFGGERVFRAKLGQIIGYLGVDNGTLEGTRIRLVSPKSTEYPHYLRTTVIDGVFNYQVAHAGTRRGILRSAYMTPRAFLDYPVDIVGDILRREAGLANGRFNIRKDGVSAYLRHNMFDNEAVSILERIRDWEVIRELLKRESLTVSDLSGLVSGVHPLKVFFEKEMQKIRQYVEEKQDVIKECCSSSAVLSEVKEQTGQLAEFDPLLAEKVTAVSVVYAQLEEIGSSHPIDRIEQAFRKGLLWMLDSKFKKMENFSLGVSGLLGLWGMFREELSLEIENEKWGFCINDRYRVIKMILIASFLKENPQFGTSVGIMYNGLKTIGEEEYISEEGLMALQSYLDKVEASLKDLKEKSEEGASEELKGIIYDFFENCMNPIAAMQGKIYILWARGQRHEPVDASL